MCATEVLPKKRDEETVRALLINVCEEVAELQNMHGDSSRKDVQRTCTSICICVYSGVCVCVQLCLALMIAEAAGSQAVGTSRKSIFL